MVAKYALFYYLLFNLGINQLFEHVYQHNRWIPDFLNRLGSEQLDDSEMLMVHQQKLIKILFHNFVPVRSHDGLEKNWSGGQIKKILSISNRILEVILEIFPNYTYLQNFLKLLISFQDMYQSMYGKILMQGWQGHAFAFLENLKKFLSGSVCLGYIQFHSIVHAINICTKYNVGLGALGLDQQIEALHSHVHYELLPNIKKKRMTSSCEVFNEENKPNEGYINKFLDLQGVQLETALSPIKLKRVVPENAIYLQTLDINEEVIKHFDMEAHGHGLLIKLSTAQTRKIQTKL